jgi:hypothetical protein
MPRLKPNLDWATGFPAHFSTLLNPQAVGGICRQLGVRPRGKPKMSVNELLMVLTAHALAPSGNLAMHAHGVTGKRVSGAALSKRRRKLPWQIFEWMMDLILGVQADPQKHPSAFWKGYRLVGLDGTMFSAKNSSGILSRIAKAASRRMGSAFAKLRVVMLVELGTHHPVAAVVDVGSKGELTLASRLIQKVPLKSLLLGDRLFGSKNFLAAFLQRWVSTERDFLVRISSLPKVQVLGHYPDGSVLAQVKVRHEGKKEEMLVREIHGVVRRRDGKRIPVRLWTSLLPAEDFPAMELLQLYARRWEQEIAFKELKIQLQGGPLLDSQTVETAMQEVACLIVAQAIVSRIRMDAAQLHQGEVLQISFAQVREHVQAFWWMCQWHGDSPEENKRRAAAEMLKYLAEHATQPRRARSCPRAVRQPVTGWPRLLRNQSITGEIHCEVIRQNHSKG